MTVSAISSRSASAAGLGLTLGLAALLSGCGGNRQSLVGAPMASPPTTDRLRLPAGGAAPVGLSPLPTPRQVVNAVPLGRRDPFAPLPEQAARAAAAAAAAAAGAGGTPARATPASGTAAPGTPAAGSPAAGTPAAGTAAAGVAALPALPRLPQGFRFSGVIRSGGRTEAVVQYGALSGSLRRGDRGGSSTDLLPRGWRVEAIDADRGQLRLWNGGRLLTVEM